MFPAEKKGEWEPLKVREKKMPKHLNEDYVKAQSNGGVIVENGQGSATDHQQSEEAEDETLFEEDPTSEEGAVFPLRDARVVNWSCFFALLTHVYNTLSPPFHTPILVISQPAWTAQDHETLTQFFFEKFKTPAFCLMDSALALCYAFAVPTATVVDVGHGKCDVTAVTDFLVNDLGRGVAIARCGGEGMTQRLLDLLGEKGFTWEICEQLKKSSICEIMLPGTALPGEEEVEQSIVNPAAAASTGALSSVSGQRGSISGQSGIPRPGIDANVGEDGTTLEAEDNEGILDVASIVASGKTSEFLAKKEKEKVEKAAAKKAAADAAAAPKARLPNSKRVKATFHYSARRPLEDFNGNGKRTADVENSDDGSAKKQKTPEPVEIGGPDGVDAAPGRKEERRRNRDTTAYVRKDIEVGVERFQAGSGGIIDQIADSIHRCILSVPEVSKRSELWDSLVIVGNGSKVKGLLASRSLHISILINYRIQGRSPSDAKHEIYHIPF